jgi:hypothetical protein
MYKTSYTYTLRDKIVSESSSVPMGTLEDFNKKVNAILEYYGHKPNFKFSASFG